MMMMMMMMMMMIVVAVGDDVFGFIGTDFYSKWHPYCIEMRIKPCKGDWEAFNQIMGLVLRQPWHAIQTSPPWKYTSVCTIHYSRKKIREICCHAVAAAKINCGCCPPHQDPCVTQSCWVLKHEAMMNAPSLWDSVPFASTTTPPMSAILVYCYIPFLHDVSVSFLLPLVNWISWPSASVQGLCHPHGCAAPPTHERVKESTFYMILQITTTDTPVHQSDSWQSETEQTSHPL